MNTPGHSSALPTPTSLRGSALAAVARGEPLVVMTTLAGCPYCDLVRNHHLLPMLRQGQLHAVQLDVRDRTSNLQGFDGSMTTPAEQAKAWKARFAPTVLFLGGIAYMCRPSRGSDHLLLPYMTDPNAAEHASRAFGAGCGFRSCQEREPLRNRLRTPATASRRSWEDGAHEYAPGILHSRPPSDW